MTRATTAIMSLTCAVSGADAILHAYTSVDLHSLLRATPDWVITGQVWRPFTANLVHIFGLPHLILNMVGLLLSGPAVEAYLRPKLFMLLYVASGFVGWIAESTIGQGGSGASPAVVGIFAALLVCGLANRHQPSGVRHIVWGSVLSVMWLSVGPLWNGTTVPGLGRIQIADYSHLGGYLTGLAISLAAQVSRRSEGTRSGARDSGCRPPDSAAH